MVPSPKGAKYALYTSKSQIAQICHLPGTLPKSQKFPVFVLIGQNGPMHSIIGVPTPKDEKYAFSMAPT